MIYRVICMNLLYFLNVYKVNDRFTGKSRLVYNSRNYLRSQVRQRLRQRLRKQTVLVFTQSMSRTYLVVCENLREVAESNLKCILDPYKVSVQHIVQHIVCEYSIMTGILACDCIMW